MATIAECAEHLFIDERTLKRHLDEGNITRMGRGAYELVDVRREYLTYLKNAASGRAQETNSKRVDAGTRKDDAIAERYELEVAQKKGELLLRSEVLAGLSSVFGRVRAKLLAIPSKLAPAVHSPLTNRIVSIKPGELHKRGGMRTVRFWAVGLAKLRLGGCRTLTATRPPREPSCKSRLCL